MTDITLPTDKAMNDLTTINFDGESSTLSALQLVLAEIKRVVGGNTNRNLGVNTQFGSA